MPGRHGWDGNKGGGGTQTGTREWKREERGGVCVCEKCPVCVCVCVCRGRGGGGEGSGTLSEQDEMGELREEKFK